MKLRCLLFYILAASTVYAGTVTGTLQGPSGLSIANGTLSFKLQQAGLILGSGSVVPTSAQCFTSNDGSVVGLPNPLALPVVTTNLGSGSLTGGTYFVELTFSNASGETLPSPEFSIQLSGTGSLVVSAPVSFPAAATGMKVYIGKTSGGETLQGSTLSSTAAFTQGSPLSAGASVPVSNSVPCSIAFNDTIIPYSGYNVSLTSASGNAYPGWPQAWQLNGGLNGTINISSGAPLWNGTIVYPQPILAQPLNHGPQSISGSLNMTGYNLLNVGALGVGTSTPAWPIDVENGAINASGGYLVNGGGGSIGQCLVSNGLAFLPGTCASTPTLYYQFLQNGGSFLPQEQYANLSGQFVATDNPASERTEVDLAPSGVTAGSYSNASITVDRYGRTTMAASGPAIPTIQPLVINSGICTTSGSSYGTCTFSATWPAAFADSGYVVNCTGVGPTPYPDVITGLFITSKTTSGFTLELQNGTSDGAHGATFSEIDCIGMHP